MPRRYVRLFWLLVSLTWLALIAALVNAGFTPDYWLLHRLEGVEPRYPGAVDVGGEEAFAALEQQRRRGVIAAGGGGQCREIHVGVSVDPVGGAKRQANRCYRKLLSFR